MEITYHREGDYLISDLKLSDTTEYQIGKYGRMRQRFLKENHGGIYSYMILSETLWKHLAEIDEECNEMMDGLVRQMAKKEGVTEQMMSRHRLRLACGGLDIICASCYGVVKGEQSSPIALKMPMAVFCCLFLFY